MEAASADFEPPSIVQEYNSGSPSGSDPFAVTVTEFVALGQSFEKVSGAQGNVIELLDADTLTVGAALGGIRALRCPAQN